MEVDIPGDNVYIICVYIERNGDEKIMKTARVFKSGNSQAVRLPKEFNLDVAQVQVFWKDGDVVLRPLKRTWQDYFDRGRKFSNDFPESIEDMALEENFPW
jgi:antitoxin VapB